MRGLIIPAVRIARFARRAIDNKRLPNDLSDPGGPDGVCVDRARRLYVAIFEKGVLILSSDGERLGFIDTGKRTTHCTFGADGQTLCTTSDGRLMRIKLHTGAPAPSKDS